MNPTEKARTRIRAIMAKFPSENVVLSRKALDSYGQPSGTATAYATLKCWRLAIDRGTKVDEKSAGVLHSDQEGIKIVLLDVVQEIKHGDFATLGEKVYTVTNVFKDAADVRTELTLI